MTTPKISIIIGSYNQKNIIKKVLEGYDSQTMPEPFELIVSDSKSNDGTKEILDAYKPKNPNFIYRYLIEANSGKAQARNRGVMAANADLIIISDSDMIPDNRLVETHYNAQKETKTPSCFEGVTLNMTHLHWPPEKDKVYPYITAGYKDGAKLGWYYFLTGNLSFPKTLFEEEGGFDESFKNYGWEDLELGYRLSKNNIPLKYLKNAINYHYHVLTHDEEIERNTLKGDSARLFLKKHPELKLFLGNNTLSRFLHKRIPKDGLIHRIIKNAFYSAPEKTRRHKFGFWFLKEHNYLTGLLSTQK